MSRQKFTTAVLVSLIFLMSLTYAGCSDFGSGFEVVLHNLRVVFAYLSPRWKASGSSPSITGDALAQPRAGIVTTDFSSGLDEINTAARQPDGKIIVAGVTTNRTEGFWDFGLARYNSDGSLDTTFGTGGKVITNFFGPTDIQRQGISSLVIQPDGKIVVAGVVMVSDQIDFNKYNFGLARYNADGSLDATFGTGGLVITNIKPNQANVPTALGLQADGKIVAAGFSGAARPPQATADFVLVRYNSNGSLDSTFGVGGKVVTDFSGDSDFAFSLIIQPDGKTIVGGGTYHSGDGYDFALARYDSSGNLDSGFGTGGKVVFDLSVSLPGDVGDDLITSMVLLPGGKILAAGTGEPNRKTTNTDFVIARFNSDGGLDATFGTNGIVATDFNGTIDFANSIALQPDGRFVVAGVANGTMESPLLPYLGVSNSVFRTHSPTASDFAVARYNANGSLDQSFGTGGKGETDIFGSIDAATKVLVLPNGNILALGFAQTTPYDPNQGQYLDATDFASVMYFGNYLSPTKTSDFDGDGRMDIAVYRDSEGNWYSMNSSDGAVAAAHFGAAGDKIVPGDYDGDGRTDFAVWRPSVGTWYIQRSRDGFAATQFGLPTDLPVPGDFDGDGKSDVAVFRPSNGTWYLQRSTAGFAAVQFGQNGDKPVAGDFDGDGKMDIAVFRPSDGNWYLLQSTDGFTATHFGISTDKVVPADYDGDGKTDIAVYRDGTPGTWYLLQSTAGFAAPQFGTTGDIPTAGDFDSDGKSDISVWRPSSGMWYSLRSTSGFSATHFGTNGDIPVPSAYVPVQ